MRVSSYDDNNFESLQWRYENAIPACLRVAASAKAEQKSQINAENTSLFFSAYSALIRGKIFMIDQVILETQDAKFLM